MLVHCSTLAFWCISSLRYIFFRSYILHNTHKSCLLSLYIVLDKLCWIFFKHTFVFVDSQESKIGLSVLLGALKMRKLNPILKSRVLIACNISLLSPHGGCEFLYFFWLCRCAILLIVNNICAQMLENVITE